MEKFNSNDDDDDNSDDEHDDELQQELKKHKQTITMQKNRTRIIRGHCYLRKKLSKTKQNKNKNKQTKNNKQTNKQKQQKKYISFHLRLLFIAFSDNFWTKK